tara:strand:+ start:646 stop:876 length:231 start_codon:yes stop_codon:yes gene_type:complete
MLIYLNIIIFLKYTLSHSRGTLLCLMNLLVNRFLGVGSKDLCLEVGNVEAADSTLYSQPSDCHRLFFSFNFLSNVI